MRYVLMMLAVLSLFGCSKDIEFTSLEEPKVEAIGQSVGDSYLFGNFYDMHDIAGYASEVNVRTNNSYFFSASSYVEHEDGEAMTILSTYNGNFHSPTFVPGETIMFKYITGNDESNMTVTVWACLFRDRNDGPYVDAPADEVEIFTELISEDVKRVNYIARWFDSYGTLEDELQGFVNIEVE